MNTSKCPLAIRKGIKKFLNKQNHANWGELKKLLEKHCPCKNNCVEKPLDK